MKRKLFEVASPKVGRIFRLGAADIKDFYNEHILGNADAFRTKVVDRIRKETGGYPSFPIIGTVLVRLFNRDGELADCAMGGNLVVTTGRELAIDLLQGGGTVADYVAIGTDSTAAAAGNTALGAEVGTRVQGTLSQPTATTDRVVSTFAAGNGTATIAEAGRLTALTSGILLARYVFTGIAKAAGDSLEITYDITD